MVKDDSLYYTIFEPHINNYLVIAIRPSSHISDRTIHENCADHEEAMARTKKQFARRAYSRKGDTEYFVLGMCRDATCDCGGLEARTDWWVDGNLRQWHYDPPVQPDQYVQ